MKKKSRPHTPVVHNTDLAAESWKILKIMSEFVSGYEELSQIIPSISIFGSARTKKNHKYYKLAQSIAKKLSNAGFSVVTGGGGGIMEAANLGAYQGKSHSIGLNIELPQPQKANNYQDISIKCRHFFVRKVLFAKYASAYIVLPGGFGTLDELTEILALVQTNKIKPIPIILVGKTYWEGLTNWLKEQLLAEHMINRKDLNLFTIIDNPKQILDYINDFYQKKLPAKIQTN